MLALMMLVGALTAGVPNATAAHGTETVSLSNVTNASASVDVANLDVNDTYYWWVFIYYSSGTLYTFDYGSISNVSGSMSYGASWITPVLNGNYTLNGELSDSAGNSLTNTTAY